MPASAFHECSECAFPLSEGDPFCPKCGHIVPNLLSPGTLALQLEDVAAGRTRSDLMRTLKEWFPALDVFRAENKLKHGAAILVSGIDESTGTRLLEAFKKMRVQGRLVPQQEHSSWFRRVLNPGLAVGGLLLVIGASLGAIPGFLLFLIGLGVPFGWALWSDAQLKPLMPAPGIDPAMDRVVELSAPFSRVIERLEEDDAQVLTSLAKIVFAVQRGLRAKSLASVAAGEERGDLSSLLIDSLATGVDLGRRIASEEGGGKEKARNDLKNLAELARSTHEWFQKLHREDVKPVPEIQGQIDQIAESIDRIVQDVRSPSVAGRPRIEKDRV
jgi:hypothetical protein